jgi:c(7)-type cytochrome triheme protein
MGRLGLFAIGFAVLVATSASAAEPRRYDHDAHSAALKKKSGAKIACNDCHKLRAEDGWVQKLPVGKAGEVHSPCSNAGCHQDIYSKFRKRDSAFCFGCHLKKLGKQLHFPPYRERGPSDYYLSTFGHKDHLQTGTKKCAQCHTVLLRAIPGSTKELTRVSHDRCGTANCHGQKIKPLMASCEGCHTEKGTLAVPKLASSTENIYRTRKLFSHLPHAKKSPKDDCTTCHANIAAERGQQVPLPAMPACETCHNGQPVFSGLGTDCAKCHAGTVTLTAQTAERPRYTHARHEQLGVEGNCASCHGSRPNGQLTVPGKNHQPCSGEACHAKEFRAAKSQLCFSCHRSNEPFKPNPPRTTFALPAGAVSEFWVGFSHKTHAERGAGGECATCHFGQAGKIVPPPPAGILAPSHVACAKCHEKEAKPLMVACGECHARDTGEGLEYRVVDKFSHDTHRVDPRNKSPLGCGECHRGVNEAALGQRPLRPTMQGCASCHEGTLAFKTTGHDCAKCHGPKLARGG